jgi:hypothetical protein
MRASHEQVLSVKWMKSFHELEKGGVLEVEMRRRNRAGENERGFGFRRGAELSPALDRLLGILGGASREYNSIMPQRFQNAGSALPSCWSSARGPPAKWVVPFGILRLSGLSVAQGGLDRRNGRSSAWRSRRVGESHLFLGEAKGACSFAGWGVVCCLSLVAEGEKGIQGLLSASSTARDKYLFICSQLPLQAARCFRLRHCPSRQVEAFSTVC